MNQPTIKSVQIVAGYNGTAKINVYSSSGERLLLEVKEAEDIIQKALNAGHETTLVPRQQYKRIHICQK